MGCLARDQQESAARERWRRPPRERKRSDIGEADGVRAIFRRSETEEEAEAGDEERGERRAAGNE